METVKASDDIADYLWNESKSFQQKALNSVFVQGLKNVSLDPSDFGAFMVQDVIHTYMSKEFIDVAVSKTIDPGLKQFLQKKAESYERRYLDLSKKWHIGDPQGIKLGTGCQKYVDHLKDVADNKEPIYLVVAITPCVKLWPWLGDQIGLGDQIEADSDRFGIYTKWIKTNFDRNYKGYTLYEDEVNNAYKEGTVDKDEALGVYQASMQGEVDFLSLL